MVLVQFVGGNVRIGGELNRQSSKALAASAGRRRVDMRTGQVE